MVNYLPRAKLHKVAKLSGVRYFSAKGLKLVFAHLRGSNSESS